MTYLFTFVLAYIQLAQLTAADWAGWLALVGIIAKIVTDQLNRIQDRLDADRKAKEILDTLAAQERNIAAQAASRLAVIRADIKDNTAKTEAGIAKAEQAIEISNGHNEKIAKATATIAEATKAVAAAKDK